MWTTPIELAGGTLLAACSASASSPSTTAASHGDSPPGDAGDLTSKVSAVVKGAQASAHATFSVTYVIKGGHNQDQQHLNQTITFAQAPPKSTVITPAGSFYTDGSSIPGCQGSGSAAACTPAHGEVRSVPLSSATPGGAPRWTGPSPLGPARSLRHRGHGPGPTDPGGRTYLLGWGVTRR